MNEVFLVPNELILRKIYVIRGQKVMLDSDLANFYEVESRVLNQAVKRNMGRFPGDFMFQLIESEFDDLKDNETGWGGRRSMPLAFTEHGILMLSSVLNSQIAVKVSQQIMRLFISIRNEVLSNKDFLNEIHMLKNRMNSHEERLDLVQQYLLQYVDDKEIHSKKIGYKQD